MQDDDESLDGATQKCETGVRFNARTKFLGGVASRTGNDAHAYSRQSPDFAGSQDSLSTHQVENRKGSQYMHTENIPGSSNAGRLDGDTRPVYLDGDLPLRGGTLASASFEGKLQTANTSALNLNMQPNAYTMGNQRDEPQLTAQSLSQSNLVLQTHTGLSEFN